MSVTRTKYHAALACAAVLAVGCGGSSGLTRAQLAGKVNAACAAYTSGLQALGPQPRDFAQNSQAAAGYLDKLKPLVEGAYNKIKDLKPDDSVKEDFTRYLAAAKRQRDFFESALSKAHANDPSGLADISSAGNLKQDVLTPLDKKLGFTRCVSATG